MSITTKEQIDRPATGKKLTIWGIGLLALFAILGLLFAPKLGLVPGVESGEDYSTTRLSKQGLFRASYEAALEPIETNQIHSWQLRVETADGVPVDEARITVEGHMPGHGHGMPSQPAVTKNLGNGEYLVEGIKFQMPGTWEMDFTIMAEGKRDTVHFTLLVE